MRARTPSLAASMLAPEGAWLRKLVLLALVVFTFPACEGANIPLTRDYRDEEEDEATRAEYYEDSAITYLDGGRYRESIEMWNKTLELRPGNNMAKWGLARAHMGTGSLSNLKEAVEIFREIQNVNWVHPERGDERFAVLRDYAHTHSEIAEHYDRDARRGKAMLESDPNADVGLFESRIYQQEQKRNTHLDQAIPIYRQVLELKEDDGRTIAGLAKAHLARGNDDMGLMWANRYIQLSKDSQEFWRTKGAEYEQAAGRNVTRKQRDFFLDKLKGSKDKEAKMHLMVGAVYMRRQQYDLASRAYTRVIQMDSRNPAPYAERAQAYASLGQYQSAVTDLEHYLKITDPVTHREGRINAGQLLDRYQRMLGGPGILGPGARPGGGGSGFGR